MKLSYLLDFVRFVLLVLLQVLLLNRISIFGVATPVIYVYFLLKQPVGRNPFYLLISGFLLGLSIDIFLNTPGMNAAATTIIAAFRKQIMNLFFEKAEANEGMVHGVFNAFGPFLRFTIFTVTVHLTLLFFIESFTVFNLGNTLLRIATSTLVSILLILALDSITHRKKTGEPS